MNNSLMMIVLTLTVLAVGIVLLSLIKRSNLTLMSGMMVAMASGMVIGLAAGVIAGILFKGDLFISTAIGASVGMIVGGLSGYRDTIFNTDNLRLWK